MQTPREHMRDREILDDVLGRRGRHWFTSSRSSARPRAP
jgi:hypothetical protein